MSDEGLIFVYGTLRPGGSAEARMTGQGRWLGPATASGRLYRISHYPGFVADPAGDVIQGALFEATDPERLLAALDIYEGCGPDDARPHEYRRIRLPVVHDERPLMAWTYVYAWPVDTATPIASGDFLEVSTICSLFVLDGKSASR